MLNIFTYIHYNVCVSDPNINLDLMMLSDDVCNCTISRHKYQMFTVFHKILKLGKKMFEEIYTYDFDLAHQTVLSYRMLCIELHMINNKVSYNSNYEDCRKDINDYYEYLSSLIYESESKLSIDFNKIYKYLDKLLIKELDTLSFEDASIARMYITNNSLMSKYETISGPLLVTKLNYDSVNMCSGQNFNISLRLSPAPIVNSNTFFMTKYESIDSNFASAEQEFRLLNTYEIFNAVKYEYICTDQHPIYRNRYSLSK